MSASQKQASASAQDVPRPAPGDVPGEIWFTRCPVPTATGLAYKLGWLGEEFAAEGVEVKTLQDNRQLSRHHYDHDLDTLVREGGSILALAARAQGARSRLVGLTWIDEWQAILVRPGSGIHSTADLKGKRLALPEWGAHEIASHARGSSISRGMSLLGYRGALRHAGLGFEDVQLIEVPANRSPQAGGGNGGLDRLWSGLDYLIKGKVDAVYVKGASAIDAAKAVGAVVGVDLDALPGHEFRINNGTPRPITVHEDFIEHHFDHLVRFLDQTLRAADWARENERDVLDILAAETRGSVQAVREAYRNDFHLSLQPSLSAERLELLETQKKFLWLYGFLERDFDFAAWVDPRPLDAALELRRQRLQQGS